MKKLKLGIVGASGLVGQTVLKVLKEENLLKQLELYLITSEKNSGNEIEFNGKKYKYINLNQKCFDLKLDIVIFSAGDEISKHYAHSFAQKGTYVIDNSNAFRKEKDIPLIVPEINSKLLSKNSKIIANPNCSTIQLAVVIDKLKQLGRINEIIVSSYQSVSGAGKAALEDLKNQKSDYFGFDIKDNFIAKIGDIEENGFCKEENKIMFELNKILDDKISVYATTVRVPISYCHGESVYVRFLQKIDENLIKNALKCDFIEFCDDIYLPTQCFDSNKTYVFRMRQVSENELMFFVLADNLRRGAAFNAVLILEKLIEILKS